MIGQFKLDLWVNSIHDTGSRARCITFGAACPSVPPMNGHLSCTDTCLVQRVSVHDRYYCSTCKTYQYNLNVLQILLVILANTTCKTYQYNLHTCQPREKFWRDKRGATERSEPTSEGGPGGTPPENLKKPTLQMVQSMLFLSYIL